LFSNFIKSLIEHIKPWFTVDVINECWRILKEGHLLGIQTPYATSSGYYQAPDHCNPWNEFTPMYFDKEHELFKCYEPKPWRVEKVLWKVETAIQIAMRKIDGKNDCK